MKKEKDKSVIIVVTHSTGSGTTKETKIIPKKKATAIFNRGNRRSYCIGKVTDDF